LAALHKKLTGEPDVEGGTDYAIDVCCPHIVHELANFGMKDCKLIGLNCHDDAVLSLAIGSYNIDAATAYEEPEIARVPPADLRALLDAQDDLRGMAMRT